MLTHRGFRYRLYPPPSQLSELNRWVGACRYLYNLALEQRTSFGRRGRPITYSPEPGATG